MPTYAITGKAGSGKSAAANIIQKNSAHAIYISADNINTDTSSVSELKALIQTNARNYIEIGADDNNAIRLALTDNVNFRNALESILHPLINNNIELRRSIQKRNALIIIEVPLLFQAGWHHRFSDIIGIISSRNTLNSRVTNRDGKDRHNADKLLSIQLDPDKYIKYCNHIIINESTPEHLDNNVKILAHGLH